jgi:hypothetical protein
MATAIKRAEECATGQVLVHPANVHMPAWANLYDSTIRTGAAISTAEYATHTNFSTTDIGSYFHTNSNPGASCGTKLADIPKGMDEVCRVQHHGLSGQTCNALFYTSNADVLTYMTGASAQVHATLLDATALCQVIQLAIDFVPSKMVLLSLSKPPSYVGDGTPQYKDTAQEIATSDATGHTVEVIAANCGSGGGSGSGTRRRLTSHQYTVIDNGSPTYIDIDDPIVVGATTSESPMNPDVDCVLSNWTAWGNCNQTCGGGTHTRTRTMTTAPVNGGTACESLSGEKACT